MGLRAWAAFLILLLLISTPLLSLASSTTTSSSSGTSGPSTSLKLTVYPDGSVGIALNATETIPMQPGTAPDTSLVASGSTSGGLTTLAISGSSSVPSSLTSEAPYNYSESISATGTYSNGISKGSITIQALSGVSSPLTSFKMNYHGNSSSVVVSENTTLQYGTYQTGSGPVVLNASTISNEISRLEGPEGGFNQTYMNQEVGLIPYAGLSVKTMTITPDYGATSATVDGLFQLVGNMTALPAAVASDYVCLLGSYNSTICGNYYDLLGLLFSSVKSYSYTLTYSSGVLGYSATFSAEQLNTSKAARLGAEIEQELGAPAAQVESTNSTKASLSDFSESLKASQASNGDYTVQSTLKGVTIYPSVKINDDKFNESSLFNSLTTQGNVTVVGGSNSAGSVSIQVPSGVPTPVRGTAVSKSWESVNMSSLSGVEFVVGQAITTTSSSSSSSSTSASSSTTGKSTGNSETLYAVLGVIALIIVVAAAAYLLRRNPKPTPTAPPAG